MTSWPALAKVSAMSAPRPSAMPVSSSVAAGHRRQIQRRMLAMIAICASQPAVKVSVRAAGMAAE